MRSLFSKPLMLILLCVAAVLVAAYVGKVAAKPTSTGYCNMYFCNTTPRTPNQACGQIPFSNPPLYYDCVFDNSPDVPLWCDDTDIPCTLQVPLTQGTCNGQCGLNPNVPCTWSRYMCETL